MRQKILTIALAGNPNSGKTTIFNNLTGTRQKVGNWPGVTVEKKEGLIHRNGYTLKIVDLPGTYSLTPFSMEEIVARDFILDDQPDLVINIIDASNLERSLYLATQIRELDCKVLFALNMADLARSRGLKINAEKLSDLLDVPVVFTVGNRNEGVDVLLKSAMDLIEADVTPSDRRRVQYSKDIETCIETLKSVLKAAPKGSFPYNSRWTAIKLLENDKVVKARVVEHPELDGSKILEQAEKCRSLLIARYNDDPEIVMTDERYGFIAGIIKSVVTSSTRQRVDISRNIDLVLTNRFLGFPIFVLFIWAMFQLTFTLGAYPMAWIESGVGRIHSLGIHLIADGIFKDLLLDGIVAGVGSVIIFLPNILILFFCIAIFEDTGYMARAAFLMDRLMHLIGLHGKSFIPMLMGFGCNVPAIMATRTLENEKDRILTILISPFMSCSARLPIYIVLAGTFFVDHAGTVIFSIYLMGIVAAILTGRLLRSIAFKGGEAPFVMELPPYRLPMFKSLLIHMWDRSKMFLKKMGGVILVGSVIIWAFSAFPQQVRYSMDYDVHIEALKNDYAGKMTTADAEMRQQLRKERDIRVAGLEKARQMEKIEKSYMGHIGKGLAPLFAPIGIEWRGSVALLTGFVAKEVVVSTMGVLYAVDAEDSEALHAVLRSTGMTRLSALAMMVFVLFYVPCIATVAAIRRETGSVKWTVFSVVYNTTVAWGMAFIIYQGGKLLGLE